MPSTLASIAAGSYTSASGILTLGPVTPPGIISTAGVQVECSEWLDTTSSVLVTLEVSKNGGSTWLPWYSAVLQGGTVNPGTAVTITEAALAARSPAAMPMIKATIEVLSGTLVTQGISLMTGI